jgi:predicted transcriptional regulator
MANLFERLESEIEEPGPGGHPGGPVVQGLSDELSDVLTFITQRGKMSLTAIVDELNVGLSRARVLLGTLVEKGHLVAWEVEGELRYRASSAKNRVHEAPLDVWEILGDKVE